MAGSELAVSTSTSGLENAAHNTQLSAIIDQWEVQYSRFVSYSSVTRKRTHPSLSPVVPNRLHCGTWISTDAAAASLKLTYRGSSAGPSDAAIAVSLRSRVLEEHYISKMHFSWPQVSCVSGFPARGSRGVIVSYKDGVGQIEKFALRFSTVNETEKFMSLVKEILENATPKLLRGPEINSELSSQAEVMSSDGPTHCFRNELDWKSKIWEDNSIQLMLTSSEGNAVQDPVSHEGVGDHEAAGKIPVFPPSFTQLMKNCHPAVSEAKPTESEADLKAQFMQYLQGTSFKELLATVEDVVSVLEGDMVL